jgi:hypothetical protein
VVRRPYFSRDYNNVPPMTKGSLMEPLQVIAAWSANVATAPAGCTALIIGRWARRAPSSRSTGATAAALWG